MRPYAVPESRGPGRFRGRRAGEEYPARCAVERVDPVRRRGARVASTTVAASASGALALRFAAALGLGLGVAAAPADAQSDRVAHNDAAAPMVEGRVVLDGWHERVPEARVQLLGSGALAVASVTSDAEGGFRFIGIDPGEYRLQASYNGVSSAVAGPLRVTAEEPIRGVDLVLPSPLYQRAMACRNVGGAGAGAGEDGLDPAAEKIPAVLAGVAYEVATATPVPGAVVTLGWTGPEGRPAQAETGTDAGGRFVFCGVEPSVALSVRAEALGRLTGTQDGVRVRPGALARMDVPLELRPDSAVRILDARAALRPDSAATLHGRLLDASTGGPIAGASVVLEGPELEAVTDAHGQFRLTGVPPGLHGFQVTRLGYDWRSQPIQIERGATMVVELRATPTAIGLEAVVVRASTVESRMAKAATQAPRILAGQRLYEAEQRAASLVEVIDHFPSLEIRNGRFETEEGVEWGVCIESSRALQRFAVPEQQTTLPWCEMIAIIIDGAPALRGSEMLKAMRLRQVESIEFLPPTGALRWGERAAINGALVIWTRGQGPHRDPDRGG